MVQYVQLHPTSYSRVKWDKVCTKEFLIAFLRIDGVEKLESECFQLVMDVVSTGS